MQRLALAGLPRILAEPDVDPIAVLLGDAVALSNIFGAPIEEVRFAADSPLEEGGFELSVPGGK